MKPTWRKHLTPEEKREVREAEKNNPHEAIAYAETACMLRALGNRS